MVSGFSTKKIKSQKTLGERLKHTREKLDLTLAAAEEGTKVRSKFLKAIEEGNWKILPQDVYVRAFVLSYAKFLDLPQGEILDLYNAELIVNCKGQNNQNFIYKNSLKDVKVLITPRTLAFSALGAFVLGLFSYIFLQVASFAGSPSLKVFSPENNFVTEIDSVNIRGITENGILLTINEEDIPVTNDGSFALNFKLHRGVNLIKVKAMNKTKKESSQILTIEYKPKTALLDSSVNQ